MFKSRTMWAAPVGPESCPCQLEGARGRLCVEPRDTSYPGLTKTVASGTSTSGLGGITVGSLAARLAEGKLLKSSEKKPGCRSL